MSSTTNRSNKSQVERAAALMDAAGASRKDIAEALEISTSSMARMRRDPEYQALVTKYAESQVELFKPLLEQVSQDVIKGMTVGIAKLIELSEATDNDGNPLRGTQMEAAKLLVDAGVKFTSPRLGAGQGGGSGSAAPRVDITFNVDHEKGEVTVGEAEVVDE